MVAFEECGPTISRPRPRTACSASRRAMKAASTRSLSARVLEQQRAQRLALDGDVAERLGHDRGDEHSLSGQEIELAEKARSPVTHDLVADRVTDRHLAVANRDERVATIADLIEHLPDIGGPLLAELGQRRQLRRGQRRTQRSPPRSNS